MQLRKVPLTERSYAEEESNKAESSTAALKAKKHEVVEAFQTGNVDPAAIELMEEIRDVTLTDRELADKVSLFFRILLGTLVLGREWRSIPLQNFEI